MHKLASLLFGIAVSSFVGAGAAHSAAWHVADLGTIGGSAAFGHGINNRGQVIGMSRIAGDQITHAFLYSGDRLIDLNTLPEIVAAGLNIESVDAINDAGQITDSGFINGSATPHAFVLTPR